jgi:hypothetical protein
VCQPEPRQTLFGFRLALRLHAQCRAYTRRQFVEAEASAPADVASALDHLAGLYRAEHDIYRQSLTGEKKHGTRQIASGCLSGDTVTIHQRTLRQEYK